MRRPHRARFVPLTAASAVTALAVAACGTTSASTTSSTSSAKPITVGISLPLTGSFAADGQATQNGYKLWASDVNTNGGLLGRPVRLKIIDDKSNEQLVTSQYTQLITQDHVDLTLAPFSTLLTSDALPPTAKYGYALPAGSATGNLVFQSKPRNLFSVSVPVSVSMVPFANWVLSLPPNARRTAAYPQVDDPFADPPVQATQAKLARANVTTVYSNSAHPADPAKPAEIKKAAVDVANKTPQIVVIGSVDLPTLLIFVHTFQAMHYTPKIMIAASGPDQGQAFLNTLNPANAQAIMVPDAWSGSTQNALSHVMVQDYIAKFGGTSSDINADVAEAYSAGEVLADAVTATKGVDNGKIIAWLHGNHTLQTVQGPVKFASDGRNNLNPGFIYQWQQGGSFKQVLPAVAAGSSPILATKPQWGQSG
jgi:branched-chain amino acid transport system substrate-binding protein